MTLGYTSSEHIQDAEGRQYHIGLAPGEVADFIMLVGDPVRATRVAGLLDELVRFSTHLVRFSTQKKIA